MYVNGNSRTVLDSARTRKREESFEKVFNFHTVLRFPIYAVSRQKENRNTTVDESNCEKRYVLLFTYAPTRAVHLELTRGVSVPAFLLAFRRFASRRGLPATLPLEQQTKNCGELFLRKKYNRSWQKSVLRGNLW